MRFQPGRTVAVMLVAATAGCSSNDSTSAEGTGHLVVQLATSSVGSTNGPAAADVVVNRGSDVLVVTQVQLVARKIRFRRSDGSCAEDADQDDAPAAVQESGESDEADNEHDCPTLKLGPLLLEPPLTDGAETLFTADVPAGTYTRIRIQLHKPRGGRDQAFLALHPDFAGVSIRVKGTYNGTPFSFDTGIEEEEEITLDSPVVVTAGGSTAFTLFLDVRGWFLDQSGTALLDPTAPSSSVRDLIEHNIRRSFRAFKDDDHDGGDDDH